MGLALVQLSEMFRYTELHLHCIWQTNTYCCDHFITQGIYHVDKESVTMEN